jgi:hypothetical protein
VDENGPLPPFPGYQPPVPGYQPSLSRRRTAIEPSRDEEPDPVHARGSLPGLAVVVGLLAFFLADAAPGDANALVAFSIAAGAVLLLFLLTLTTVLIVRRRRRRRSRAVWISSEREFLRVLDELLAAIDSLPEDRAERIENELRRFAAVATAADSLTENEWRQALRRVRGVDQLPEYQTFVAVSDWLSRRQLHHVSVVLESRKALW